MRFFFHELLCSLFTSIKLFVDPAKEVLRTAGSLCSHPPPRQGAVWKTGLQRRGVGWGVRPTTRSDATSASLTHSPTLHPCDWPNGAHQDVSDTSPVWTQFKTTRDHILCVDSIAYSDPAHGIRAHDDEDGCRGSFLRRRSHRVQALTRREPTPVSAQQPRSAR